MAHQTNVTVIGDNPEAILLSVLLAEAGNSTTLVSLVDSYRSEGSRMDLGSQTAKLLRTNLQSGMIKTLDRIAMLEEEQTQVCFMTDHADDAGHSLDLVRRAQQLARLLTKDNIMIYTGLCPPSYSTSELMPLLERQSGYKVGEEIGFCYMPLLWRAESQDIVREQVRIIAGRGKRHLEKAQELLLTTFPSLKVAASIGSAETAGLYPAVYREVVQALELELAQMCLTRNIDYSDVVRLCPIPNVHGQSTSQESGRRDIIASRIVTGTIGRQNRPQIVRTARRINQAAPQQILGMVKEALGRCGRRISRSRIAILGVEGIGLDLTNGFRDSELVRTLVRRGAIISLYPGSNRLGLDGHEVKNERGSRVTIEPDLTRAFQKAQCAIVALRPSNLERCTLTPQKLAAEMDRPAAICDLSGVLEASNVERSGLFYSSIGRGNPVI